jgi:hypothetical protein
MADNVSNVKNQLTTMYGGGYARLADSQGNIYRLVNILEATVNFDTKQDFLRAIYPNSPSQVIAVATTENNVTLAVKMGEFTKEFIGLASNLTYSMLNQASFPVYNETHIMLTTRTRLRYTPLTGSTVHVYHRNKGIETELVRVGGLVSSAKLTQPAVVGQFSVVVDDVTGFSVNQFINVGTQSVGAITAIDSVNGILTFQNALTSARYPFSSGAVITNATSGSGATTCVIASDTMFLKTSGLTLSGGASGVAAKGTITVSGTPVAGTVTKADLDTGSATYTVLVGDTAADVATGLAAAITAATLGGTAAAVGNVVTVTWGATGVAGNNKVFTTQVVLVNSTTGFNTADQFTVNTEDHELYTIATVGASSLTFSPGLVLPYTGPHNQDFAALSTAGVLPAVGEYALDVDEIVVHPSIVGQGLSVDYERMVGDGVTPSVYKIGGDSAEEIGYVDFHLVLQNQQGKWLYYRFPAAIPTGKYSLDMKGSFMSLPEDFTAITPPGWIKPYLLLGEL